MVRAVAWDGLTCGPSTAVLGPETDLTVLRPFGLVQVLSETSGFVSEITLPARTRIVRVYSADEDLRGAIDEDPQLEAVSQLPLTDATAFTPGDTILRNAWHEFLVQLDSTTHVFHVTSTGTSAPRVRVVALVSP